MTPQEKHRIERDILSYVGQVPDALTSPYEVCGDSEPPERHAVLAELLAAGRVLDEEGGLCLSDEEEESAARRDRATRRKPDCNVGVRRQIPR